ncbi:TPA: type 1 fimbrial protein [Klebsiella aerogenes]|nr:type 1 fimbrial protein [Klebsiella aerogenes]
MKSMLFSKGVVGAAVVACAFMSAGSWATNKLVFSGTVVQSACQISGSNGDVNVDFGDVDFSQDHARIEKAFSIDLVNCPTNAIITVGLNGGRLDSDSTAFPSDAAIAPDTGEGVGGGVGISVLDSEGRTLTVDGSEKTNPDMVNDAGAMNIPLKAVLAEDFKGSAVPGKITASEDIVLTYQ